MKRKYPYPANGFTLAEVLVAVSAGAIVLAAVTVGSVSLQKSFSAADNFLGTQMQQIRIVDYLSRDVRRSYIVSASADLKTITCIIPNYVSGNVRSTPIVRTTKNGTVVSYPTSRSVMDAIPLAVPPPSLPRWPLSVPRTLGHRLPVSISHPTRQSKVS